MGKPAYDVRGLKAQAKAREKALKLRASIAKLRLKVTKLDHRAARIRQKIKEYEERASRLDADLVPPPPP